MKQSAESLLVRTTRTYYVWQHPVQNGFILDKRHNLLEGVQGFQLGSRELERAHVSGDERHDESKAVAVETRDIVEHLNDTVHVFANPLKNGTIKKLMTTRNKEKRRKKYDDNYLETF